eukprot:CAMPEP_0195636610 /NCGR_PEP_ID=MMETSP0815-20121206/23957_1 /TAXON_ID=97485 /ORGANISM="Prymnesium parvum, Strain Texoma1" /LENGTH=290 /DNA_ID=CAMNT_0040778723 /DNA_START=31 /DNA_END=900 /DNA_ORIENTATION=+
MSIIAQCGTTIDCPPRYDAVSRILASAADWDPHDPDFHLALRERHATVSAACIDRRSITSVLPNGSWCLSAPFPGTSGRHSGGVVSLGNETHILPRSHYPPDRIVVAVLHALLHNRIPSLEMDRPQSVNDFGAGVGQYGHALRMLDPGVDWRGYDGAGNVENYTSGFVRFFDLTMPLSLPKADWLLSLEVGEHVPHQWEYMVLRNLHVHQRRGIIVSWAALGQLGTGHVNNHNQSYVRDRFLELGYEPHTELERLLHNGDSQLLRAAPASLPSYGQMRRNILAFIKKRSP